MHLVWIDMEMSGLNPENNTILEIALVITDDDLNIVHKTDSIYIKTDKYIINNMDKWNTSTHTKSGLINKVLNGGITIQEAEELLINTIKQYAAPKESPLCGNTVYHDRKFIIKYMPLMEYYLHYRLIDVSSIKELAKRWYRNLPEFVKSNKHEAMSDILESIEELKYYRRSFMLSPD